MNAKFLKECLGIVVVAFAMVACAGGLTPKDPLWDREACAHCRMTISQHRYATQLLGPGASVRYYDDLGCALKDIREHPGLGKGRLFVRPFGSENWIPAQDATYAGGLQTPMGYGFGPLLKEGRFALADVEAALGKGAP